MEVLSIVVITGLFIIFLSIRYYLTKNFDYWKIHNVAGPKPIPLFGTFKNVHLSRISIADYMKSVYDLYPNEPAVGLFFGTTPTLLVKEPKIIKDILIKSFSKFPNRGINIHPDIEPLQQNLLFLEYERWKPLRRRLMPTFTLEKLKQMFYLINECADHLCDYLKDLVSNEKIIDCHELTDKFTIDAIGVCVFGLKMNAIADENSEFRKIGRAVFADTLHNKLSALSRFWPHWIVAIFKQYLRDENIITFFINIVKSTMEYRKKNNIRRHDFISLLMDIRDHPEQVGEEEISDEILTAQAFIFFSAGFETSSTTISSAMYELALNPNIQEKLREEIKDAFRKDNGKLTYTAIKNMHYLDKVIQETLRKYPSIPGLPREAMSDHTFSDSNISITKGTKIIIPVYAIHNDPNIYPDPEKFDPERFDKEAVKLRPQLTYLPFGDGPRFCIGKQFADNLTKLGLATLLIHFKLEVCDKTCKNYKKQPGFFLMGPKDGLYIRIKKL